MEGIVKLNGNVYKYYLATCSTPIHKGRFGAALFVGRLHCCVCMCQTNISFSEAVTTDHTAYAFTCTFAIGSHFNDFTAFMFIIIPYMVISE